MTKQSKNTLRNWFKNGAFPDQFHFWDWMDSFFHKDEQIPASQIDQLQDLLDAKVDRKDLPDGEMAMDDIYGLNSALDGKVDKQDGKGLSAEDFSSELKTKLDGLEEGANNYEHPLTHSANMIEETADKAFTSEAEKIANANHIANKDIHETSEQIRSEIVDGNIPESIARLTDISVSSLQEVTEAGATSDQNVTLSGEEVVLGDIFNANVSVRNDPDNSFEFLQQSINMSTSEVQFLMNKTEFFVSSNDFETGNVSDFKLDNSKIDLISPKISAVTNELRIGLNNDSDDTRIISNRSLGSTDNKAEIRLHKVGRGSPEWEYSNNGTDFFPFAASLQRITDVSGATTNRISAASFEASSRHQDAITIDNTEPYQDTNPYGITFTSRISAGSSPIARFLINPISKVWQATTTTAEISILNKGAWDKLTYSGPELSMSGQFSTSNTSPLGSAPGGSNATSGHVLTADGSGGSSWEEAGGGTNPTLQSVTDEGATTTTFAAFSGGVGNATDFDTSTVFGYQFTKSDAGTRSVKVGANAGWAIYGGQRANNLSDCVFVGYDTRASADGVTNENVFGYYAQGKGNNTVTLGNHAITAVHSMGTYITPAASPLGSAPLYNNVASGKVLTADGSGGSSWEDAAGGGSPLTLQEVTDVGATTTTFTTFTGGAGSSSNPNTSFGFEAGLNSTDDHWTAIGYKAGTASTTGGSWTAIGSLAGTASTTGDLWTAVGWAAGKASTTGLQWVGVGAYAGLANVSGDQWTAIGRSTGMSNINGSNWVALGASAGFHNTSGSDWVGLGAFAGLTNASDSNWLAVGHSAARMLINGSDATSFPNSVYVGYDTRVSANGVTNENVFGYKTEGKGSNTVTLGNSNVTDVFTDGTLNSSNASPLGSSPSGTPATNGLVLTADGSGGSSWAVATGSGGTTPTLQEVITAGSSVTSSISSTNTISASNFILSSDETLKTFSEDSVANVDDIAIRKFTYNDDSTKRVRHGISAQELQKAAPEMVYEDTNEDKTLRVAYIDFLLAKVANQDDKIEGLEKKIDSLMRRMEAR